MLRRQIGPTRIGFFKEMDGSFIEDLLGRDAVQLDEDAIHAKLSGKTVLVTGAAGSIGFELCLQIARFDPRSIVGFDIAETGLFHLERQMHRQFPHVHFQAELGNIQNPRRLDEIFEQHRPLTIYHAAAYKHVPMAEAQVFEALENNVLGTHEVMAAAAAHAAEDFVLFSSDKAVAPASIMGATKRLAELLILSMPAGRLKCVAVRFGNVLGSDGSVFPLFLQQIEAGGPVTVTHPEMRRYFMTAAEASQLSLQAAALGKNRDIFLLDMGDPVRIVDLARKLIRLCGRDIPIEFTGIRPGEKLFEETNHADEESLPTSHDKIRVFAGNGLPEESMTLHLTALRELCRTRNLGGLVSTLRTLVPDYNPSREVLRRVHRARSAAAAD